MAKKIVQTSTLEQSETSLLEEATALWTSPITAPEIVSAALCMGASDSKRKPVECIEDAINLRLAAEASLERRRVETLDALDVFELAELAGRLTSAAHSTTGPHHVELVRRADVVAQRREEVASQMLASEWKENSAARDAALIGQVDALRAKHANLPEVGCEWGDLLTWAAAGRVKGPWLSRAFDDFANLREAEAFLASAHMNHAVEEARRRLASAGVRADGRPRRATAAIAPALTVHQSLVDYHSRIRAFVTEFTPASKRPTIDDATLRHLGGALSECIRPPLETRIGPDDLEWFGVASRFREYLNSWRRHYIDDRQKRVKGGIARGVNAMHKAVVNISQAFCAEVASRGSVAAALRSFTFPTAKRGRAAEILIAHLIATRCALSAAEVLRARSDALSMVEERTVEAVAALLKPHLDDAGTK